MRYAGLALLAAVVVAVLSVSANTRGQDPPGRRAEKDLAKKFIGTWKGTMDSPGFGTFPVTLVITEYACGKWCGVISHPDPLDAGGKLLGVKVEGRTLTVAQSIERGRDRCLDGLNELTLLDDDTLERVWFDPETGKSRDAGRLKRQR